MAIKQFTARIRDSRTIEIPEEARDLGLEAGDEVTVSVSVPHRFSPHDNLGHKIMSQIAERHKSRRMTNSSTTERLLHEARAGAAYGCDPAPTE